MDDVARGKELRLAREQAAEVRQQLAATAEILRVIRSTPTDLQSVLDAVVESAARLCASDDALVRRADGDSLRRVAHFGSLPEPPDSEVHPIASVSVGSYAFRERRVIHVEDIVEEFRRGNYLDGRELQRPIGYRTVLAVPLLGEEAAIGVILIRRMEVRPFTDKQIELLETFADQAVIAIENARLFNETKEALERQTAISEILRVISRSPSDVNPVLQAVAERAARICEARVVDVILAEGDAMYVAATVGELGRPIGEVALDRTTVMGRSIIDRAPVQVRDLQNAGEEFATGRERALKYGHRTTLAVPLLREDRALGAILVRRPEVRLFENKHVELLKTFADQAAIAIENARLFNDTKEALERQTATAEILKVISESPTDVQPVFNAIVESCRRLFGGMHVALNISRGDVFDRVAYSMSADLRDVTASLFPMPLLDDSVAGRAMQRGELVHVEDLGAADWIGEGARSMFRRGDHRSALSAPLMREGKSIGAINVFRDTTGRFKEEQVALLRTFADQAVIAIENVRLFHALQEKNAQIEAASRHKSEFLANMSHELRTPLNAILGFSEVLGERYFGELNKKQDEYVKDIRGSGEHLLSLINDVLDLSKVEAGKMELELSEFDLPAALKNVVTLVKERAQRHGIAVSVDLGPGLGAIRADERKLKQIMLNLLSNAVKFTPDGGAITVRARLVNQMVEIAVADTGAGIAPQDLPTVFEEFKQVGSDSARKAEGTGLGLPLAKKFVELHGGEIRVESDPGAGSTFTIMLPSH